MKKAICVFGLLFLIQLLQACPNSVVKINNVRYTSLPLSTVCNSNAGNPKKIVIESCTFPLTIPISYVPDIGGCTGHIFSHGSRLTALPQIVPGYFPAVNPTWNYIGARTQLSFLRPGKEVLAFAGVDNNGYQSTVTCGNDVHYFEIEVKQKNFTFDVLDRTVCTGTTIYGHGVTGNPWALVGWSPNTYLSNGGNGPTTNITPLQTQTYNVTQTTSDGCVHTDQTTIQVIDPTTFSIGNDANLCSNNPAYPTLNLPIRSISSDIQVTWKKDGTVFIPSNPLAYRPNAPGSYCVEISFLGSAACGKISSCVFIDVDECYCDPGATATARAKFAKPMRVERMPSKYGKSNISVLCHKERYLFVDGAASSCEDRYYVELAEFDLMTWSNTQILKQGWVCTNNCRVPGNLNIKNFLPPGYQLDKNKVYHFKLAVGMPWDETHLFFKIDKCNNNLSQQNISKAPRKPNFKP